MFATLTKASLLAPSRAWLHVDNFQSCLRRQAFLPGRLLQWHAGINLLDNTKHQRRLDQPDGSHNCSWDVCRGQNLSGGYRHCYSPPSLGDAEGCMYHHCGIHPHVYTIWIAWIQWVQSQPSLARAIHHLDLSNAHAQWVQVLLIVCSGIGQLGYEDFILIGKEPPGQALSAFEEYFRCRLNCLPVNSRTSFSLFQGPCQRVLCTQDDGCPELRQRHRRPLPSRAALPHQESIGHTHNASWCVSRLMVHHHELCRERVRPRRDDALSPRARVQAHALGGFGQCDVFPWHVVGRSLLCRVRLNFGACAHIPGVSVPLVHPRVDRRTVLSMDSGNVGGHRRPHGVDGQGWLRLSPPMASHTPALSLLGAAAPWETRTTEYGASVTTPPWPACAGPATPRAR